MELITNDAEGTDPEIMQSLDELAREGARRMIVVALELEVDEYVSKLRQLRDEDGHALVVRNGHAQERTVTLGAGPVKVSAPRVNDRRDKQRFAAFHTCRASARQCATRCDVRRGCPVPRSA
jgi:hypothetical protein